MKIDAIQMLDYNKKLMANGLTDDGTVGPNFPTTNPDGTLKALDIQGNYNNPAFGMSPAAKKFVKPMMALAILAGAAALQSCEKYEPVKPEPIYVDASTHVDIDVNIDLAALVGAQNQTNAYLFQMLQEVQAGRAEVKEFMKQVLVYLAKQAAYQDTQLQDNKEIKDLLKENNAFQTLILNQLVANGMSQAEANAYLADILASNMSSEQILARILDAFGDVTALVADIKAQIKETGDSIIVEIQENSGLSEKEIELLKGYLNAILNAQYANNAIAADTNKAVKDIYAKIKAGTISFEEALKLIKEIKDGVVEILGQLKANGEILVGIAKTQKENGKINQAQLNALTKTVNILISKVDKNNSIAANANKLLASLIEEVQSGKISMEEAMQQLLGLVDDIKATLDVHTDLFIEMCENQDATNKYLKSYTDAFRKAVNTIMAKIDMNTSVTGQGNMLAYQANQLILQLIEEVKAGKIDFQEAIQKILDLGNDIKATLDVHTDLFIDMCEKQDSTNEYLKTYTDAFRKAVNTIIAVTGQGNALAYQANQLMVQLIDEVKSGKIDFQEAIQKILELGNDIKASIDVNTTVLKGMAQVQVNNGKITQAQLNKLTNAINQLNAKADINNTFAAEANKMLKQLIADVEAGKITIEEATAQLIAMMNDIVTIIKQDGDRFQSIVDILLENRQIDQQHHDEIIEKMNNIYEEVKNGNLTEAQAYNALIELVKEGNMIELDTNGVLKKFYQAWEDHEAGSQETYDKIINLLDIISGKLDKIINQMTSDAKVATERFNAYSSYFKELIAKIGQGGGSAADLTKVEALLKEVSEKESSILDAIKSLPACEGMTYVEFKAYMDQRDPKFVASFEAMFDSFGDEILNKLDDMSDLQEVMIGDFDEFQEDCLGLLGKIYNSVKDLDLVELQKNNPEKYDYLMNEILEPFKCHCCGCDCPDYTLILKEIEQKLDKWNEGIKDPGDLFG